MPHTDNTSLRRILTQRKGLWITFWLLQEVIPAVWPWGWISFLSLPSYAEQRLSISPPRTNWSTLIGWLLAVTLSIGLLVLRRSYLEQKREIARLRRGDEVRETQKRFADLRTILSQPSDQTSYERIVQSEEHVESRPLDCEAHAGKVNPQSKPTAIQVRSSGLPAGEGTGQDCSPLSAAIPSQQRSSLDCAAGEATARTQETTDERMSCREHGDMQGTRRAESAVDKGSSQLEVNRGHNPFVGSTAEPTVYADSIVEEHVPRKKRKANWITTKKDEKKKSKEAKKTQKIKEQDNAEPEKSRQEIREKAAVRGSKKRGNGHGKHGTYTVGRRSGGASTPHPPGSHITINHYHPPAQLAPGEYRGGPAPAWSLPHDSRFAWDGGQYNAHSTTSDYYAQYMRPERPQLGSPPMQPLECRMPPLYARDMYRTPFSRPLNPRFPQPTLIWTPLPVERAMASAIHLVDGRDQASPARRPVHPLIVGLGQTPPSPPSRLSVPSNCHPDPTETGSTADEGRSEDGPVGVDSVEAGIEVQFDDRARTPRAVRENDDHVKATITIEECMEAASADRKPDGLALQGYDSAPEMLSEMVTLPRSKTFPQEKEGFAATVTELSSQSNEARCPSQRTW